MPTAIGPFDERTEVPVGRVNGWECWYGVIARTMGGRKMPGQTNPAAARESRHVDLCPDPGS